MAIQGARQTGKSFLARELLAPEVQHAAYVSFDHLSIRQEAELAPHTFLATHQKNELLIIDEAQKVPDIFDAVKLEVDQKRTPGRFLLLGSTEFSRLARIRESLTGRMGRVRLFPMTLGETLGAKAKHSHFARAQTMKHLSSGGMPGIFSVRDEEQKDALFQDWIDLTCLRDLQQFKSLKLDSELAYSILKLAATLEDPTRAAMARALRVDPRKVGTHLTALCELFVLMKLNPHPSGTGKPIYLPLDAGVAAHLGAPLLRRLHIWLAIERMAYNQYFEKKRKTFYYYRSTGKKSIHLVEESIDHGTQAFQLMENERILKIDAELMSAFFKKNPGAHGAVYAPVPQKIIVKNCTFLPWEKITAP